MLTSTSTSANNKAKYFGKKLKKNLLIPLLHQKNVLAMAGGGDGLNDNRSDGYRASCKPFASVSCLDCDLRRAADDVVL